MTKEGLPTSVLRKHVVWLAWVANWGGGGGYDDKTQI